MQFYRLSQMITHPPINLQDQSRIHLVKLCRIKSFGKVIETHFSLKMFFVSWISLETCPGVLHLQTVTAGIDSIWKVKLQTNNQKSKMKTQRKHKFFSCVMIRGLAYVWFSHVKPEPEAQWGVCESVNQSVNKENNFLHSLINFMLTV